MGVACHQHTATASQETDCGLLTADHDYYPSLASCSASGHVYWGCRPGMQTDGHQSVARPTTPRLPRWARLQSRVSHWRRRRPPLAALLQDRDARRRACGARTSYGPQGTLVASAAAVRVLHLHANRTTWTRTGPSCCRPPSACCLHTRHRVPVVQTTSTYTVSVRAGPGHAVHAGRQAVRGAGGAAGAGHVLP